MRNRYFVKSVPRGKFYRRLLDYALTYCDKFLLVERPWPLGTTGKEVLSKLKPFLLQEMEASEWPGTRLMGHTAVVRVYEYNGESAQILKEAVNRLYDWVIPELPEDLCLLRKDGEPWLASIAHERDAYFVLTQEERLALLALFPTVC